MKKNEITIWTSGTCGHCQTMKTTLEKEKIEFNENTHWAGIGIIKNEK